MHEDLRRRALESGKTVSRKARSKQSSAGSSKATSKTNSRNNSRPPSKNGSRQNSDEEDDVAYFSDDTAWSATDGVLSDEDIPSTWEDELNTRIESLLDRKRSSVQGREDDLTAYVHIVRKRFSKSQITDRIDPLVAAFMKSIKSEASEKEVVMALKAIQVTMLTQPSESIYDNTAGPLKTVITSSASLPIKAEALHTLGVVTFYGGVSEEETEAYMAFLLEAIESDGDFISAQDDADAVTSALNVYAFLATQLDDMEDATPPAMDALVEQLDSSDLRVQVAAGEAIALLYEKSYTEVEEDEDVSALLDPDDPDAPPPTSIQRYEPYRRKDQLLTSLDALANVSSKRLSKKDRRSLHSNFADVLQSVRDPTLGPRYSAAIDADAGKRYGSRLSVRVGKASSMRIDRWWKLHRLKALRRVLQGGFLEHYERNEVVLETLPVLASG